MRGVTVVPPLLSEILPLLVVVTFEGRELVLVVGVVFTCVPPVFSTPFPEPVVLSPRVPELLPLATPLLPRGPL